MPVPGRSGRRRCVLLSRPILKPLLLRLPCATVLTRCARASAAVSRTALGMHLIGDQASAGPVSFEPFKTEHGIHKPCVCDVGCASMDAKALQFSCCLL